MFAKESAGTREGAVMRTGPGLVPKYDYMPPENSAYYQQRPLPTIPPRRSMPSSSSLQTSQGLNTPLRSPSVGQFEHGWKWDVDDLSSVGDSRMGAGQDRLIAKLDLEGCPGSNLPTLHNSPQKIKQLTGLDIGWGGSGQSQRRPSQALQEGVSPLSVSSSMYSQEGLETTISEPDIEPSIYSYQYSYMDDEVDQLVIPFSPPEFGAFPSLSISTPPVPPTSVPSGFHGGSNLEALSQVGPVPPAEDDSQPGQESGANSWTSSWGSSLTDPVVGLYHNTASDIAKSSTTTLGARCGEAKYSPLPAVEHRSIKWDQRPDEMSQKSRLDLSSSSCSLPPTSIDPLRKTESFSERRASGRSRIPPPLVPSREAPKPGRYSLPRRTPYPPSSSGMKSTFDEDDGGKRFPILSKVFSGGSGNDNSDSSGLRRSWASPQTSEAKNPAATVLSSSLGRLEEPDSLWPNSAANHGRRGSLSMGVFQRTMESARQSVGLKSKAEKRREDLRGKIRVVGLEGPGVSR
ncbi:hypothetical protein VPNG_00272 [Cytospora leucostoma]|uniref:Uncharacterized protein n=1 Tax=Cytospora leucostoma TaxID=1230097 RepID=A0A423XP10_9PEZI|nr:hypothetical protein VPNG_00272 [Cytospora leucostoma]